MSADIISVSMEGFCIVKAPDLILDFTVSSTKVAMSQEMFSAVTRRRGNPLRDVDIRASSRLVMSIFIVENDTETAYRLLTRS